MSMGPVTRDKVEFFTICGDCDEHSPCFHTCEVGLYDGRYIQRIFTGHDLAILTRVLPQDKITIVGCHKIHFDDRTRTVEMIFMKPKRLEEPDAILTAIFASRSVPSSVLYL